MTGPPDCSFCAIVAGEIDAEIVHSDETTLAFLDHRPLFPGHVLLILRLVHKVGAGNVVHLLHKLHDLRYICC